MSGLPRILALIGAASAWSGLAIQLFILMTGELGPVEGAWRFLAFFTILINALWAWLFTAAALNPSFAAARPRTIAAGAVYIAIVAITYALFLQSTWNPEGLQLVADMLLHYATPLIAIVFWVFATSKETLRWTDPLVWGAGPLLYLIYYFIRAAIDGFHPYVFLNPEESSWLQVFLNIGGFIAAFVIVGLIVVAIGKRLAKRAAAPAPEPAAA